MELLHQRQALRHHHIACHESRQIHTTGYLRPTVILATPRHRILAGRFHLGHELTDALAPQAEDGKIDAPLSFSEYDSVVWGLNGFGIAGHNVAPSGPRASVNIFARDSWAEKA